MILLRFLWIILQLLIGGTAIGVGNMVEHEYNLSTGWWKDSSFRSSKSLHKVTSGFDPHISFSWCEFDLAVHDIELESAATLHYDSLFKVKNPEFGPALEFILHHCRRKLWPPYNLEKQNEQGVMIEICSQIFSTSLHWGDLGKPV